MPPRPLLAQTYTSPPLQRPLDAQSSAEEAPVAKKKQRRMDSRPQLQSPPDPNPSSLGDAAPLDAGAVVDAGVPSQSLELEVCEHVKNGRKKNYRAGKVGVCSVRCVVGCSCGAVTVLGNETCFLFFPAFTHDEWNSARVCGGFSVRRFFVSSTRHCSCHAECVITWSDA